MGEVRKVRTVCRGCHGGCGVIAHVEDGRVVRVEGNPEFPIGRGTLCSKGLAVLQLAYHSKRVLYPMKKVNGRWERISWEEALDTVAERFSKVAEQYGPEAIVVGQGTGRDYADFLYRFANLLGTPNVLTAGHMCYVSRVGASLVTCGNLPVCDYEGEPKAIVVWGCNPLWTNPDEYKGEAFWRAYKKGAKLVVIDPRRGFLAERADLWLQLRPGTDAALAFGFLNVIIEEGLYDRDFVERHVHGWDAFCERVREYPLKKVSEITWVKEDLIRRAAELYATTRPACIHWGVPTEQTINCTDCTRLLIALMAVTGNLDAPGGNVFFVPPPVRSLSEFARHRDLPAEQRAKRLGGDRYKLAGRVALITPKAAWDAILTGKPYPLKAGLLCGTNPVVTRANAREAYEALKALEFLVVIDLFLTPTAELADVFLPSATWLEQDLVAENWKRHGYVLARQKAMQMGECWQDHKIFMELGKRLGQQWWDTLEEAFDWILEPSGLTWQKFKEVGYLKGEMSYHKYRTKGFSTPTGKVELYCTTLERWGYDPLPTYREIPESPLSRPDLLERYPYILNAGLRNPLYFHSEGRQLPWLRGIRPDPIVEIHPDTAKKHGIEEGDWVWVESPRGRVKQRARLNDGIDPRVVVAEHGWWFPEVDDPGHGWDVSNINILTDNSYETLDPMMGSTNLRVCLCSISRCEGADQAPPSSGVEEAVGLPKRSSEEGRLPEGRLSLMVLKRDCMGCHACEVACRQEHGHGLIRVLERGASFLPVYCRHCAKPPCKDACPTGAIWVDQRGLVLIREDDCIGCMACLEACPFGAIRFDEARGVASKCDLCLERISRGEEPACSRACPTRCIVWGRRGEIVARRDAELSR